MAEKKKNEFFKKKSARERPSWLRRGWNIRVPKFFCLFAEIAKRRGGMCCAGRGEEWCTRGGGQNEEPNEYIEAKRIFWRRGSPTGRRVTGTLPRSFAGVKFGHKGWGNKKWGGRITLWKEARQMVFSWMPFEKRTKVNKPKASCTLYEYYSLISQLIWLPYIFWMFFKYIFAREIWAFQIYVNINAYNNEWRNFIFRY